MISSIDLHHKSLQQEKDIAVGVLIATMKKKADLLFLDNKYQEALVLYQHILDRNAKLSNIWFNVGLCHKLLKQYAESLYALSNALKINPNYEKANYNIKHILHLLQEEKSEMNCKFIEKFCRPLICKSEYLLHVKELQKKFQTIAQLNFQEKVDFILEQIDFMLLYYNGHTGNEFLIDKILEKSNDGDIVRLNKIGNVIILDNTITEILGSNSFSLLTITQKTDCILYTVRRICLQYAILAKDDICFDDSKVIFRNIFRTIANLDRRQRHLLTNSLPWGEHSWYLLDFCATFFISSDTLAESNTRKDSTLALYAFEGNMQKQFQFSCYFQSVLQHAVIVKVAIQDIIKYDLGSLKELFINIQDSNYKPQELPNLKTLLWYSKHIYNIYKLLCITPAVPGNSVVGVNMNSFHTNNIGSDLDLEIDFHKYLQSCELEVPQETVNIYLERERRGKKCTVRDLYKYGFFTGISSVNYGIIDKGASRADCITTNNITTAVRMELSSLENILNINETQGCLALLRKLQLIGEIFTKKNWGDDLIKIDYINYKALQIIRNGLTHIEDFTNSVVIKEIESNTEMLGGIYRELQTLKENLYEQVVIRQAAFAKWPNNKKQYNPETGIWKEFATKYWLSIKKAYETEQDLVRVDVNTINAMTNSYPHIDKLASRFLVSKKANKEGHFNNQYLFELIEERMNILKNVVKKDGLKDEDKTEFKIRIKEKLQIEVNFLLSMSYILGQIFTLLRKAYTRIKPELMEDSIKKWLIKYVALRNHLEHVDPIFETVGSEYYHMDSDAPERISAAVSDIIFDYWHVIHNLKNLSESTAEEMVFLKTEIKQIKPIKINKNTDMVNVKKSVPSALKESDNILSANKVAAEQGNMHAQYTLAKYYSDGKETAQNIKKTIYYYTLVAQQGHPKAQYRLAIYYNAGYHTAEIQTKFVFNKQHDLVMFDSKFQSQDYTKAKHYFKLAAKQGHPGAQTYIGIYYYFGQGVKQNYDKGLYYFNLAAKQGEVNAYVKLGDCYLYGHGVIKNCKLAKYYLELASKQDHYIAQYNLGILYQYGDYGIRPDAKKMLYYYKLSAKQNFAAAQDRLGDYYRGSAPLVMEVAPHKKMIFYYKLAADNGDADAQFKLSVFYQNGYGVIKDEEQSIYYMKLASKQGKLEATFQLGSCYISGRGVPQNVEKGMYYYRQAAEKGHDTAQFNLGCFYETLKKDNEKAGYYYKLASKQGNNAARERLQKLKMLEGGM